MTKLSDFLNFRKLITPTVVKVIYALGAVLITASLLMTAIGLLVSGSARSLIGSYSILGFFGIIVLILVSNLVWRLYCELIIVLFGIHESLQDIRNKKK